MHWFDTCVTIALILSGAWSLFRGLIREILSIVGLSVAFILAMRGHTAVAELLRPLISAEWGRQATGFALICIAVLLVSALCTRLLRLFVQVVGLSLLDRLGGLLFGLLRVVILASAFLTVATKFAPPLAAQLTAESRLAPWLLQSAVMLSTFLEKRDQEMLEDLARRLPQSLLPFPRPPAAGVPTRAPEPKAAPHQAPEPASSEAAPAEEADSGISREDARALKQLLEERLQRRPR